ncbi:nuclear transport factor 2 family protein [Pseudonocardia endophytica]|uniref:Ketosteroid isomerase-like protein n=1 Tax=Pseudonocardia endophytica TaxID=401976 RepID=A0A4V2PJ15_PSEEN|nr:nuclear transport factor 2 family protein [Pseudonocardia endophytica]TCK26756.1 ketosteroid isomerase-like protein [Pseudonocardia endophytica]
MTLASQERTTSSTTAAVTAFFDAYRAQDVEGMVDCCSDGASFEYIPFEMWGRQRVTRGAGKVRTLGKPLWTGMIDAFPDLTNTVRSITADAAGNAAVQVVLSGTQSSAWGTIAGRGLSFSEPNLFVMRVDDSSLIESITCYWDCASVARQLGHLEVD